MLKELNDTSMFTNIDLLESLRVAQADMGRLRPCCKDKYGRPKAQCLEMDEVIRAASRTQKIEKEFWDRFSRADELLKDYVELCDSEEYFGVRFQSFDEYRIWDDKPFSVKESLSQPKDGNGPVCDITKRLEELKAKQEDAFVDITERFEQLKI